MENHPQPQLRNIWPLYIELVKTYRTLYATERDIGTDESLMLFKKQLRWEQFMPFKRARFSIKSSLLCEFKSGYIWNSAIYTGKGTDSQTISRPTLQWQKTWEWCDKCSPETGRASTWQRLLHHHWQLLHVPRARCFSEEGHRHLRNGGHVKRPSSGVSLGEAEERRDWGVPKTQMLGIAVERKNL